MHSKLKVLEAFKRALTTWGRWIDNNVDKNRTLVFFRGYSYSHFRYTNFSCFLASKLIIVIDMRFNMENMLLVQNERTILLIYCFYYFNEFITFDAKHRIEKGLSILVLVKTK